MLERVTFGTAHIQGHKRLTVCDTPCSIQPFSIEYLKVNLLFRNYDFLLI